MTSATQLTFGSVYIICSLLFALNTFLQKCLCHQVCAHGFVGVVAVYLFICLFVGLSVVVKKMKKLNVVPKVIFFYFFPW